MAFYQCIKVGGGSGDVMDVEVNGTSVVNPTTKIAEIDIPTADEQTAVDEFETYNGGLLSECKVALSPNQDLHGYAEPWVGGASKNKAPLRNKSGSGLTFVADELLGKMTMTGTATEGGWGTGIATEINLPVGSYVCSATNNPNNANIMTEWQPLGAITSSGITFNVTSNTQPVRVAWIVYNGTTYNNVIEGLMIRSASETDPAFAPYSNICPISGHTQVEVDVSDGQTTQEQVTVNLGGTYYSGTLDVVSGEFVPDTAKTTINDCISNRTTSYDHPVFYGTISGLKNGNPIMYSDKLRVIDGKTSASDFASNSENGDFTNNSYNTGATIQVFLRMDDYSDVSSLKSAIGDAEIVYELATPQSIQLTPQQVKALVGENHLSAPLDGQEITESKYRELFTWDEVEEYVNANSGGVVDYSTTEVDTGIKWIDGKPIYMRTFTNVGLPQNAYSSTLDLGVEADTIVKIEANDSANAGNATIIFEGVYAKINKTEGSNTILNPTNQLAHLSGATLTVYYTKATD